MKRSKIEERLIKNHMCEKDVHKMFSLEGYLEFAGERPPTEQKEQDLLDGDYAEILAEIIISLNKKQREEIDRNATAMNRFLKGRISANTGTLAYHKRKDRMRTKYGEFDVHQYKILLQDRIYLALTTGDVQGKENVLTRIQSECLTGESFTSASCTCKYNLKHILRLMSDRGNSLFIHQPDGSRSEGSHASIMAGIHTRRNPINRNKNPFDPASEMRLRDEISRGYQESRDYSTAAYIIKNLGVASIILISDNPHKRRILRERGIAVAGTIYPSQHNQDFIDSYNRLTEAQK